MILPPVVHDPGGVVTGSGRRLMIADRGWIRSHSEVARNVDAEISRLVSLAEARVRIMPSH
jgi:hypothetical protein